MIDRAKIYAVKMPDEKEALSLALYVTIATDGKKGIGFKTPGERGHFIEGTVKKESRNGFTFESDSKFTPGIWEFTEVTFENFKKRFHKIVYGGKQLLEQVHNTQELQDYYHANFPDYT